MPTVRRTFSLARVARFALALLALVQLTGLVHALSDVWQAVADPAHVHGECPDDDTGDECPPGCPDCHCAHMAHAAVPSSDWTVTRAADLKRQAEPIDLSDRTPPSPHLPALFRPPRA